MFTPHDWRNGADYSDETYESFHNTFETYDKDLIKNHIGRIRQKIKKPNFYRRIRYKVLAGCSEDTRLRVILAEKRLFLLLNTLFFNKLKKF